MTNQTLIFIPMQDSLNSAFIEIIEEMIDKDKKKEQKIDILIEKNKKLKQYFEKNVIDSFTEEIG